MAANLSENDQMIAAGSLPFPRLVSATDAVLTLVPMDLVHQPAKRVEEAYVTPSAWQVQVTTSWTPVRSS